MNREVEPRRAEEYYINLLADYGQDEKAYRALNWQDEQTLPAEFIEFIYSDAFLEMLNGDIKSWYEDIINNIKASEAYRLFEEKAKHFFMKESIFDNLVEINSHIIEVYEYQKKQSKNIEHLKQTATLLRDVNTKEDNSSLEIAQEPTCLTQANQLMEELIASYKSLQKQHREMRCRKRKLGYLMKKPLYDLGILKEKNNETVLEEQLQVLEQKINNIETIRSELQERYDIVEAATEKLQREILTPQAIGELTNIQQQLPLTNDAILKQIVKPLMRQIHQKCGIAIPKGAYCFKVYIEVCILKAVKGKAGNL